jgi:hypothetical protein
MKYLSDLHKKRGISAVVGYALLISMTMALSVLVFQWLRFYVGDTVETDLKCPEGVSIIISDASCSGGSVTVSLKNKGRHSVDGFIIRANDRADAKQGFNTFGINETILLPGDALDMTYQLSSAEPEMFSLNLVEVQSFKNIEGKQIFCDFVDRLEITCT